MAEWKNLDTLKAYKTLMESDHRVDIKKALSGDAGAERVKKYSVPMACGMTFNFVPSPSLFVFISKTDLAPQKLHGL